MGVMTRSFPPHPNPLPPGERVGHSSPQQSWGVFWHILIKLGTENLQAAKKGKSMSMKSGSRLEKMLEAGSFCLYG